MTVMCGDCLEVMATLDAESIDAIVTDPPYGLGFMGKAWDLPGAFVERKARPAAEGFDGVGGNHHPTSAADVGRTRLSEGVKAQAWHEAWAREAFRVAKPSAYLLAFGGTRTVHRMTCAIEDAGWIIRDLLVWGYACLSDDTEILTEEGWVRYNSPNVGQLAAAFDPRSGELRWEAIQAVHRYDHRGQMVQIGPQLVTLNHRVVLDETTARVPRLPDMWHDVYSPVGVGQEGERVVLLPTMQRRRSASRSEVPGWNAGRLDGGVATLGEREDVRAAQSGLEGRRYRVQEAREILRGPVRSGAGMGTADGAARRLRDGASTSDGGGVRLPVDPDGMREPRGPRSDEQRADEPDALAGQPDAQALRMGQVSGWDGGPDPVHLIRDYSGVVWCITVPSGAFVARRNGVVFITGNSGFPKSKASLKPAWEPIVMARKPGPLRMLNIDGCRIGTTVETWPATRSYAIGSMALSGHFPSETQQTGDAPAGRWPANIVLTDPIFDGGVPGVVGGGEQSGGGNPRWRSTEALDGSYHGNFAGGDTGLTPVDTSGTYSRFFLVPKADRTDREPVLGGLPKRLKAGYSGGDKDGELFGLDAKLRTQTKRANVHPTVKPTNLMRHLVRLVTPPGGTVLDPFLGSGTTALAAEMEGFAWAGIEREAEYVAIAEARLNGTQRGLGLGA